MRVFTLICKKPPPGTGAPELRAFFSQFGPLSGDGVRFPSGRGDPRFFIDYKSFAAAKKALATLSRKSHPEWPVFKFDIDWSAATRRDLKEAAERSNRQKLARERTKRDEGEKSDNTDDLFDESDAEQPPVASSKKLSSLPKPSSSQKKSSFVLSEVLGSQRRKVSEPAGKKDGGWESEDAIDTVKSILKAVVGIYVKTSNARVDEMFMPSDDQDPAVLRLQDEAFANLESIYADSASRGGTELSVDDLKSNISVPCLRTPLLDLPFC